MPNLEASRQNPHRLRWAVHRAVLQAETGSVSSDPSETARLAPLRKPSGLSVLGPSKTPLPHSAMLSVGRLRATRQLVPASRLVRLSPAPGRRTARRRLPHAQLLPRNPPHGELSMW